MPTIMIAHMTNVKKRSVGVHGEDDRGDLAIHARAVQPRRRRGRLGAEDPGERARGQPVRALVDLRGHRPVHRLGLDRPARWLDVGQRAGHEGGRPVMAQRGPRRSTSARPRRSPQCRPPPIPSRPRPSPTQPNPTQPSLTSPTRPSRTMVPTNRPAAARSCGSTDSARNRPNRAISPRAFAIRRSGRPCWICR